MDFLIDNYQLILGIPDFSAHKHQENVNRMMRQGLYFSSKPRDDIDLSSDSEPDSSGIQEED